MKRVITLLAIVISNSLHSQTKDTMITWYGMPFYDTLPDGRVKVKTHVYRFDHIPTAQESLYVRIVNEEYYKRLPKRPKSAPKNNTTRPKKAKVSQ